MSDTKARALRGFTCGPFVSAATALALLACRESYRAPEPQPVADSLVAPATTRPPTPLGVATSASLPPAAATDGATAASTSPPPSPWPPTPPSGVTSDFCIELVDALDDETCYALPSTRTDELLIYLHGTVPPTRTSPQKTSFETVVATASRRANVAALMPRGRRGLAAKGQLSWWAWPTTAGVDSRLGRELVRALTDKRLKLEALTGTRFSRVYLAGSSSGAYFAAALALEGGFEADAFAAISGGSISPRSKLGKLGAKPFYIGYGRYDPVGAPATALGEHLRKAGWPVKVSVHPLPHGTSEIYLDEAFAFWRTHGNSNP